MMPTAPASAPDLPPAIVLAAFGTVSKRGRDVYEVIAREARRRYPRHRVRTVFTSRTVVARLRGQGEQMQTLEETLAGLRERGCRRAALQSLTVAAEPHPLECSVTGERLQIACGTPLLTGPEDIDAVLDAVAIEVAGDRPTVFVTHGSAHNPRIDRIWEAFAMAVEKRFDRAVACSLKGAPGSAGLQTARRLAQHCRAVHFVPMLLSAGAHIHNDVLGDAPDSWKNRVGAEQASCAAPLGYNPAIRDIFFRHLDAALAVLDRNTAR